MADAKSDISAALEKALIQIRDGDEKAAEETVLQAVRDAEAAHGHGSPELAGAYNDLGSVLMQLGRYGAAVEMPAISQARRAVTPRCIKNLAPATGSGAATRFFGTAPSPSRSPNLAPQAAS